MSPALTLPPSRDLSHHVSSFAKSLAPNALAKFGAQQPDCISFAGGSLHEKLLPMQQATFTIPPLSSLGGDLRQWMDDTANTETIVIDKGQTVHPSALLDLSDVLHYPRSNGYTFLRQSLEELNHVMHSPKCSDIKVYLTLGNMDAISKITQLVLEPGVDTVLVDRHCYAGALHMFRSRGIRTYPIDMRDTGMDPENLEQVLGGWNEEVQGKKPHVLYIIPGGQNPTGALLTPGQYDKIYDICYTHDLLIIEDDLYSHLQFTPYNSDIVQREADIAKAVSEIPTAPQSAQGDDVLQVAKAWNRSLATSSFVSRDVDGRVLRCDSLSKTLGAGYRLGWITCNSAFLERLMRISEISTQNVNNFSQAVAASILSDQHWGVGGYIRWLWGMRLEYQRKRDVFLDHFYHNSESKYVSLTPSGAGMYLWATVHTDIHPRYTGDNTIELIDELWEYLITEGKVTVIPGKLFLVEKPGEIASESANHLRICFSEDIDKLRLGAQSLARTITKFFQS